MHSGAVCLLTLQISSLFNQKKLSIDQSCISRVVQVIKSLQDPLEVENNLTGVDDIVRK